MKQIYNLKKDEIEIVSGGNESEYGFSETRDWPIVDAIIVYIGGRIANIVRKSLRPGEN